MQHSSCTAAVRFRLDLTSTQYDLDSFLGSRFSRSKVPPASALRPPYRAILSQHNPSLTPSSIHKSHKNQRQLKARDTWERSLTTFPALARNGNLPKKVTTFRYRETHLTLCLYCFPIRKHNAFNCPEDRSAAPLLTIRDPSWIL